MSDQSSPSSSVPPPVPQTRTSKLAVASLVLGILGVTCLLPVIGALLALIFGVIAAIRISNSGGRLRGQGHAIAGLALGGVGLLIIPIMAAMLLPALAQAREKARRVHCMSNMKQIGVAIAMYAEEHDKKIPRRFEDLRPYAPGLDKLLVCPSARDDNAPSYEILLGGKEWGSRETIDAVMVTEPVSDHRQGRNALYGDGHVEFRPEP